MVFEVRGVRSKRHCEGQDMIVREHKARDGRIMLAVCDSDILGRKFEDGDLQLDLGSDFYKGEELSDAQVEVLVRRAYMISFVGKKSVGFGIKHGLISKERAVAIAGVPYAQVLI